MNLQGHAGSRAQLGHHVLREPSGIKTHLVLLFWSDTVYLYYYIIFINIRLPAKFRKYVSIIWFQILVALILLVLAAVGEYYQVSKNTPVSARLRIVSFLLPHTCITRLTLKTYLWLNSSIWRYWRHYYIMSPISSYQFILHKLMM